MKFTDKQLDQWLAYEKVRITGKCNMLAPEAMRASKLSRDDYLFVLENYTALAAAHKESLNDPA